MVASAWTQVRLLVWKNFILQKRRKLGTVFEILLPAVFFLLLWFARSQIDVKDNAARAYCSYPISPIDYDRPYMEEFSQGNSYCSPYPVWMGNLMEDGYRYIAYAPQTDPDVVAVMDTVRNALEFLTNLNDDESRRVNFTYVGFDTEAELEDVVNDDTKKYLCGVVFMQDDGSGSSTDGVLGLNGNKIHYKLRFNEELQDSNEGWGTGRTYPEFEEQGPRENDIYRYSGFATVQHTVDMALMYWLHPNNISAHAIVRVKPFPFPEHEKDSFMLLIRMVFPLLLIISYIYTALNLTRSVVYEKEKRLKEAMKMMGLSNWVHWLSWFLKALLFSLITVILITVIFSVGGILNYSENLVVFVFLLLYAISTIAYCFMLSTLFSSANVASAAGGLLFFLAYVPYMVIMNRYDSTSTSTKQGMCLLSPTCVGIGANILSKFETSGVGLRFSNLHDDPSDGDDFSMGDVFGMLIFDTLLYLLLTWYIEAVFPGTYGVPQPFYFFLKPSYWCGHSMSRRKEKRSISRVQERNPNIEPLPLGAPVGISIQNLRKVYNANGFTKVAVDGLNLDMVEGQITALLGTNGAGKTSTMSILVGLYTPSEGTAYVNGFDVRSEMSGIRESLGLCPQFDVLFDTMTVAEHLEFFMRLKGVPASQIKSEIDMFVKDLDLEPQRHSQSSSLSGGQKRSLSVAIAFAGGSKVIILDEPSSGMDPFKRRLTWDLLLKHKAGRTVLLTTHFMDEADLLGDRIAIMADGKLRTAGSSMFLKSRYGVGYRLTLVKAGSCSPAQITTLIQSYVPDGKLVSNVGAELMYLLPKHQANRFPVIFQEIERHKSVLGLQSYGVSVTTMEEVFLRVAAGDAVSDQEKQLEHAAASDDDARQASAVPQHGPLKTGMSLRWTQFKALFIKKAFYSRRNLILAIAQLLLPVWFTCVALAIALSGSAIEDSPSRMFTLTNYPETRVLTSSRDIGFDTYTGLSNSYQENIDRMGARAATAYTQDVNLDSAAFLASDSRTAHATVQDATGTNMTDALLVAAKGYVRTNFFKKRHVAFSFAEGAIQMVPGGGSLCQVRVNNTYVSNYNLVLAGNQTYEFFMFKSIGSSSQIHVYRDVLHTDEVSNSNENGFSTSGGTQQKYYSVVWTVDPSLAGSTFYYTCSNGAVPPGTPINIVAAPPTDTDFSGVTAFAWYSMQPLHAMAESINVIDNVLARNLLGDDSAIYTYSHPLPKTTAAKIEDVRKDATGFNVALMIIFGMAFLLASFVLLPVTERMNKAKHIQFVSGVTPTVYWTSFWAWDLINMLLPTVLIMLLFIAFDVAAYNTWSNLGLVLALLMLFAWSALPMIYVTSFWFATPPSAYVRLCILMVIGSLAMLLSVFVLSIPDFGLASEADVLKIVFMINPVFALSQGLLDMFYNYQFHEICDESAEIYQRCIEQDIEPRDNYADMSDPGVGRNLAFMFATGIVYFVLTLLIENGFMSRNEGSVRAYDRSRDDEDVLRERLRIEAGTGTAQDVVVVQDLSKVFNGKGRKNHHAVNHLSFGVPRGECFGLLGVNGAGKTTTFRMLTGEIRPSKGEVKIDGLDLFKQRQQVCQRIGYCPQYDGLIGQMTGTEVLYMFARLRGVPDDALAAVVKYMIQLLDLSKHCDRPCGTYSGGNKRKLSTAIALIGNPKLVFLDEPTSGMDVAARRHLWNALITVLTQGQSIVLTSHSMDECEALCTRLAIMVNGQFRCLGSTQHLKSRFGRSYTMHVKVIPPAEGRAGDTSAVKAFVAQRFAGTEVMEEHNGEVTFKVPETARWAELFSELEGNKARLNLDDYSISQTSLEQIFLGFAANQHAEPTASGPAAEPAAAGQLEAHRARFESRLVSYDDTHVYLQ